MRIFPVKTAMATFGIKGLDMQGLPAMQQAWDELYMDNSPWTTPNDEPFNIPSLITYQVSRLAVSEAVISAGHETAQKIADTIIAEKLQPAIQLALIHGDCVLRPWLDANGKTHIDIYRAMEFIPTAFVDSLVTSGIFMDTKIERDSTGAVNKTWTKLEYQAYDPITRTVTISVRAFYKPGPTTTQDLGSPVELAVVPEWATITPDFSVENMDGPLFVFLKTPWLPKGIVNTAFGASLFADAIPQIRGVNKRLAQINWEFDSAQRRMVIDDNAIPRDENGNETVKGTDRQLFRKMSGTGAADNSVKDLWADYSPTIRITEYTTDIKTKLALASIACHMDSDYLQFDQKKGAVTATEVVYSAKESYATVCNVQTKIALPAIKHILLSFSDLLTAFNIPGAYSHEDIDGLAIAWNDGIMDDPKSEQDTAQAEVSLGLRSKKSYLIEIRGLSEEDADKELQLIQSDKPVAVNPFAGYGG